MIQNLLTEETSSASLHRTKISNMCVHFFAQSY